jgi:hypothetical protein
MGLGPTVYAVSWTEFGVVTALFAARLYVNAFILRRFRADFWWATVTYVCPSTPIRRASPADANISLRSLQLLPKLSSSSPYTGVLEHLLETYSPTR